MDKIAFVNHRYGMEITGGSERHCRILAEQLKDRYEVEVLTTCAIDDATWANYYKPGCEWMHGVYIRRFQVQHTRNWDVCRQLDSLLENDHSYEEEIAWIQGQGPYCPELFEYIHGNYGKYRAVIFMTYLYYTTAMCMLGVPNALLLPTAHDEPAIYLPHYKRVFREHNGFIFNTVEEMELTERIFGLGNLPYEVCGIGICLPDLEKLPDYRKKYGVAKRYIMYAGRIAEGKGCAVLFQYFQNYKKKYKDGLQLVLIGNREMDIPQQDDIKYLGFVEEDEKISLMQHAEAFVIASHFESLSIVALEAMAAGRPIIVSARCAVLKGHCKRSRAGFPFEDYNGFEQALMEIQKDRLSGNQLSQRARSYVEANYNWDTIISKIENMIRHVPFIEQKMPDLYRKEYEVYHEVVPFFRENNIAVVFAADDPYTAVLSVAIQSVLAHTNMGRNYDIVILSDGIRLKNRKLLLSMADGMANVSIRFLEVGYLLDQYAFQFTNTQLSRATFLRLLLPDVMRGYDKIIYLDGDTVVTRDLDELFSIDMKDNIAAAVEDPHIALIRRYRKHVREHLQTDIGLKEDEKYFNAGVLMINLEALRKSYTVKDMIDMALERRWMWEDQDVLNKLCRKKVLWLPDNWNVLWVANPYLQEAMETGIHYFRALYDPYIIHYAGGGMPVKRPNGLYADEFWKAANKTPFYELLVNQMPRLSDSQPVIPAEPEIFGNVWQRKVHSAGLYMKMNGLGYVLKMLRYNFIGICKYGFHNDAALTAYVEQKKAVERSNR